MPSMVDRMTEEAMNWLAVTPTRGSSMMTAVTMPALLP